MAASKPPPFKPPPEWRVYKKTPGLVLGFHGCDRSVGDRVLSGKAKNLVASANDYDWLGDGIYFWESDPWRALSFATDACANRHLTKGKIDDPYVVGAIIDLGHCCNLLEVEALRELKAAYEYLEVVVDLVGDPPVMPKNEGHEMGLRFLDKAVIKALHKIRQVRKLPQYDSMRAAFIEGAELYPKAGFHAKNHIQIAVRNPSSIRGYFRLPGL